MKFTKLFLIPVAASVLAAPVMAQYGSSSGQTNTPNSSGSSASSPSRQSSGSSGATGTSGMSGSSMDPTFTITSTDKSANTIKVRASGQDLSQFKQGQQISLNLEPAASGPGRSDQTPSRGNEPYGQAKKGVSATVVSMDQSAKIMTLRVSSASDFSTLQTGSQLRISQESDRGSMSSSPSSRSTDSQGLSGGSGTSGSSGAAGSSPSTSPSSTRPSPDRQPSPNDNR